MNAREFLDSLKKSFNISYDRELADLLGTSKEALDKWIIRNKIPDKILNKTGHYVIGNKNINISGSNYSIFGNYVNHQIKNFDEDIIDICYLLQEYGSAKMKQDLKTKLLQIKALHDE